MASQAAAKEAEDAADVAHSLIKEGKLDEAEQVVDMQAERIEAIQAAAPPVPAKPVAPGASLRDVWEWEVEDEAIIPRQYLKIDDIKINGYVRAMKDQGRIPGVRIYKTVTVASRVR